MVLELLHSLASVEERIFQSNDVDEDMRWQWMRLDELSTKLESVTTSGKGKVEFSPDPRPIVPAVRGRVEQGGRLVG